MPSSHHLAAAFPCPAERFGIVAPAGTPAAVVDKLNAQINVALKSPEVQAVLDADGATLLGGTPARFADVLKSDIARLGKIEKEANIKAN